MWNGFSLFMLSLYWAIGFLSCHYQSLSFVPINGSADAFGLFHFVINCFSFFANEAPLRPSSSPLLLNFKLKSFPWPPGGCCRSGTFQHKILNMIEIQNLAWLFAKTHIQFLCFCQFLLCVSTDVFVSLISRTRLVPPFLLPVSSNIW